MEPFDQNLIESCPLPITDGKYTSYFIFLSLYLSDAISHISAIAQLCMQFQQIIEMNELDISQYSTMSMSTKLNLSRNDFT